MVTQWLRFDSILSWHVLPVSASSTVQKDACTANWKLVPKCECDWFVFFCLHVALQWTSDLSRLSPLPSPYDNCDRLQQTLMTLSRRSRCWKWMEGLNHTLNNTTNNKKKSFCIQWLITAVSSLLGLIWSILATWLAEGNLTFPCRVTDPAGKKRKK